MEDEAVGNGVDVLLGNGLTWFGSAAFLLGLAGEHVDALASRSWARTVGFVMIVVAGVGLVVVGALDNRPIRDRPATTRLSSLTQFQKAGPRSGSRSMSNGPLGFLAGF